MEWRQKVGVIQGRNWGFKISHQGSVSQSLASVSFCVLTFFSEALHVRQNISMGCSKPEPLELNRASFTCPALGNHCSRGRKFISQSTPYVQTPNAEINNSTRTTESREGWFLKYKGQNFYQQELRDTGQSETTDTCWRNDSFAFNLMNFLGIDTLHSFYCLII